MKPSDMKILDDELEIVEGQYNLREYSWIHKDEITAFSVPATENSFNFEDDWPTKPSSQHVEPDSTPSSKHKPLNPSPFASDECHKMISRDTIPRDLNRQTEQTQAQSLRSPKSPSTPMRDNVRQPISSEWDVARRDLEDYQSFVRRHIQATDNNCDPKHYLDHRGNEALRGAVLQKCQFNYSIRMPDHTKQRSFPVSQDNTAWRGKGQLKAHLQLPTSERKRKRKQHE
jgi:hypothetical protein